MKRRIGIVTIVAALLMLVGVGVWASQFVYTAQLESPVLVANASTSSSTMQVSDEDGIVITSVEADSPAAEAGVKRGNILLQINGKNVKTLIDVLEHLDSLTVGDEVTLNLLHGDEARTLTATTGERNDTPYLGFVSCDGMEGPFFDDMDEFEILETETYILIVEDVVAEGAAEAAGLQKGDQILALDGTEGMTGETFMAELLTHQPSDTVTLTIERKGEAEPMDVEVTLGENDAGEAFLGIDLGVDLEIEIIEIDGAMGSHMGMMPGDIEECIIDDHTDMMPNFDFDNENLPEGEFHGAIIYGIKEGSAAGEAGLQEGDLIAAIDGEAVAGLDSFFSTLASHQPDDTVTLSIWRDGEMLDMAVTLGASKAGQARLGAQFGEIFIAGDE